MKIALVTPYDYPFPGGVTEHTLQLDREFRRRGHDTRIIAASSTNEETLDDHVIKVSGAVSSFPFSGSTVRVTIAPQVFQRIKKILKQEQFDVVHAHEPAAPLCPIVLYHSRAINIGTFHAYREHNTAYQITRPILTPLYKKLDGRIFVSQAVRDFTLATFEGDDHRVIPNGIDAQRFSPEHVKPIERFDDGRPNILYVGRLDKRKGFEHLLTAFPKIQAKYPDARLLVVEAFDSQDKEPYVRYVRKHRIRGVHFIGYVSRDELPRYYRTASCFCAPSTGFESFGIVLLEAMASGVPIVASDITGYRQVLTDGCEGMLVPPSNAEAIAEGCSALLGNPAARVKMGAAGRATALKYDWSHIADKVLAYYDEARIGASAFSKTLDLDAMELAEYEFWRG